MLSFVVTRFSGSRCEASTLQSEENGHASRADPLKRVTTNENTKHRVPMPIPTQPLGKTGANVSIICLGGWHIGQPAIGDAEAERIMHAAIDNGVTFFYNAWDYHDGRSEEIMGKALASGGRRQKIFLMTKNCGR